MKKSAFLSTLVMAVLALMPSVTAQTQATTPAPQTGRGNCDLMASNTVRAIFRGVHEVAVSSFTNPQAIPTQVAVFEVVENLAHRRLVRYGDGALQTGTLITISMNRNQPGQPMSVVEEISQMKLGEEAVMKIDHLFMFGDPEGLNIRPCTRLARKPNSGNGGVNQTSPAAPTPPVAPTVPTVPVRPTAPVIVPGTGSGALMGGGQDDSDTIVE